MFRKQKRSMTAKCPPRRHLVIWLLFQSKHHICHNLHACVWCSLTWKFVTKTSTDATCVKRHTQGRATQCTRRGASRTGGNCAPIPPHGNVPHNNSPIERGGGKERREGKSACPPPSSCSGPFRSMIHSCSTASTDFASDLRSVNLCL